MAARNHITRIVAKDVVTEQDNKTKAKAQAETRKQDPKDADQVIAQNTKDRSNPNTELDSFEEEVAAGRAVDEDQKKQTENEKGEGENKDQPAEEGLTVVHPVDSKERDGEEVEKEVSSTKKTKGRGKNK